MLNDAALAQPAELPLVRVPAPPDTSGPLILLLSGDGDWAPFPRRFSELAAAHGGRRYLDQA